MHYPGGGFLQASSHIYTQHIYPAQKQLNFAPPFNNIPTSNN